MVISGNGMKMAGHLFLCIIEGAKVSVVNEPVGLVCGTRQRWRGGDVGWASGTEVLRQHACLTV